MSVSDVRRSTTAFARKHSRVSLIAAGAAAAGMLTAGTAAAGVAPWSAAAGNVAKTAQADGPVSTASAFSVNSILKTATHNLTSVAPPGAAVVDGTGTQLTALHSAGPGGSTAPGATATPHALLAAPAVVPHHTTNQAGKLAAKVAPAKPAPAKPAPAKPAPAKPVAKPKPAPPAQPFLFYDSVTPGSLPAGEVGAVYANGSYAASPSSVGGHGAPILWIDTNGSDPHANVLDVEPGDATPAGAAQWVETKMTLQPHATAIVYTMLSDWGQVKADIAGLPGWMQSHVQYWIADPTGYPHIVPGSSATQWYWGSSTDESSATATFGH